MPATQDPHLLSIVCTPSQEQERFQVWSKPLDVATAAVTGNASVGGGSTKWDKLVSTAWKVDPRIALAMAERFPSSKEVTAELHQLLAAHADEPRVQALPHAGMMLAANTVSGTVRRGSCL